MATKNNADTENIEIDIQYSETVDEELILSLSSEIESQLNVPKRTRILVKSSVDIPAMINIVVNTVPLLVLLGVYDYFKTRIRERAKIDAQNANERRKQKVHPSNRFVTKLSELRHDGVSISIVLHYPERVEPNHFGGLHLKGTTKETIAAEIDVFIRYIPALLQLIDTEITPRSILGGVYLKLVDDDLEVSWIPQDTMRKQVRVLRLDVNE